MLYLNFILTILCIILILYPIMIFYVIKKYGNKIINKLKEKFLPNMGGNNLKQSMDIQGLLSQMFQNPKKR
jgi:TM2 domain-containing membrane protein YozV